MGMEQSRALTYGLVSTPRTPIEGDQIALSVHWKGRKITAGGQQIEQVQLLFDEALLYGNLIPGVPLSVPAEDVGSALAFTIAGKDHPCQAVHIEIAQVLRLEVEFQVGSQQSASGSRKVKLLCPAKIEPRQAYRILCAVLDRGPIATLQKVPQARKPEPQEVSGESSSGSH